MTPWNECGGNHSHDNGNDSSASTPHSSCCCSSFPSSHSSSDPLHRCFPLNSDGHRVTHIAGLEYYPNFLNAQEQSQLLDLIDNQPWQSGIIARRQQFYGQVYYHTSFKSQDLQPTNASEENVADNEQSTGIPLHSSGMQDWLERTRPFFASEDGHHATSLPSQVLVNEYRNNLGIASHFEDVQAFGSIIVTISLVRPIYMTLKRPVERTNSCTEYLDIQKIFLEPGSLLVMKDQARYEYRHGIGKAKWVHMPGVGETNECSIKRDDSYRRVSLTIRHLLQGRRKVRSEEDELETIKDPSVY